MSARPLLFHEAVGRVIREMRTEKGFYLRDVSAFVSPGHLSEIENGHKQASSEMLRAIAEGLCVPIAEIIYRAGRELEIDELMIAEKYAEKTF